jgi:Alpha/beta hydrolase domain containing 18
MLRKLYARCMYRWETALTTRDSNRVVRPVEWGFDWLDSFVQGRGMATQIYGPSAEPPTDDANAERAMIALNDAVIRYSKDFYSYPTPTDFRLEERYPQLFPTNVRPETLAKDAKLNERARLGKVKHAQFLRFTSPERTIHPENDLVNARWYPAAPEKMEGKPKQAMIVMPQWNADAFSHNALCTLFNRFGISALRLSKPYHDIRRPAELERSDYACSSNIGRTLSACRQAVVDIRASIDWLEQQGYEQFGVLGTSLGSCYAFIAAAHDPRIQVCAFNHASTSFGDVVWTGQSTRHIRAAFEGVVTPESLSRLWAAVSPIHYMDKFASMPRKVLVVHGKYDLTFLNEFSLKVIENFRARKVDFVDCELPCGHYTLGETPFKYMDGWALGSFIYKSFKQLAEHPYPALMKTEAELISR